MRLEDNILAYLDGTLDEESSAELLHTLSVSPEKRALLEQHLKLRELMTLGQKPMSVPLMAERSLAERIPALAEMVPYGSGSAITNAATNGIFSSGLLAGAVALVRSIVSSPVLGSLSIGTIIVAGGLTWYLAADHNSAQINNSKSVNGTTQQASRAISGSDQNYANATGSNNASSSIPEVVTPNNKAANSSTSANRVGATVIANGAAHSNTRSMHVTTPGSAKLDAPRLSESSTIHSGSAHSIDVHASNSDVSVAENSHVSNPAVSNPAVSNPAVSNPAVSIPVANNSPHDANANSVGISNNVNANSSSIEKSPLAVDAANGANANSANANTNTTVPLTEENVNAVSSNAYRLANSNISASAAHIHTAFAEDEEESGHGRWQFEVKDHSELFSSISTTLPIAAKSALSYSPVAGITYELSPWSAINIEMGQRDMPQFASQKDSGMIGGLPLQSYSTHIEFQKSLWSLVSFRYTLNPENEYQIEAGASAGAAFGGGLSPMFGASLSLIHPVTENIAIIAGGEFTGMIAQGQSSTGVTGYGPSVGPIGIQTSLASAQSLFVRTVDVQLGIRFRPY